MLPGLPHVRAVKSLPYPYDFAQKFFIIAFVKCSVNCIINCIIVSRTLCPGCRTLCPAFELVAISAFVVRNNFDIAKFLQML